MQLRPPLRTTVWICLQWEPPWKLEGRALPRILLDCHGLHSLHECVCLWTATTAGSSVAATAPEHCVVRGAKAVDPAQQRDDLGGACAESQRVVKRLQLLLRLRPRAVRPTRERSPKHAVVKAGR
eukprot:27708-Chlamydomonas_euryale.AAC.6